MKRKTVEEAIKWLNSPSLHRDKTRINLYLEKRTAHEESIKHKEDLFKKALEMSKADPRNESPQDQEASYHHWVAENHKRLHAAIQTAYMDWVTTANKTDVEYYLGHVDPDLNKAIKKVLESQVNSFFASFPTMITYCTSFYRRQTRRSLENPPRNLCVCVSFCGLLWYECSYWNVGHAWRIYHAFTLQAVPTMKWRW